MIRATLLPLLLLPFVATARVESETPAETTPKASSAQSRRPQSTILVLSGEDGAGAYEAGVLDALARLDQQMILNVTGISATSTSALNAVYFALAQDPRRDPEHLLWPTWRDAHFELVFPGDATCAEYAALTKLPFDCTDDRPYGDRDELATQTLLTPLAELIDGVQAGRWPWLSRSDAEVKQEAADRAAARNQRAAKRKAALEAIATRRDLDLAIQLTATQPRTRVVAGNEADIRLRIAQSRLTWSWEDGRAIPRFISPTDDGATRDHATALWLPAVRSKQTGDLEIPGSVLAQVFRASAAFPMFSAPRPITFCAVDCRPESMATHTGLQCTNGTHLCTESFTDGLSYGRVPLTGAVELADRGCDKGCRADEARAPKFVVLGGGTRTGRPFNGSTDPTRADGKPLKLRGAAYYTQYVADVIGTGSDTETSALWRHRFTKDGVKGNYDRASLSRIERSPITADFSFLALPAGLPFMRGATPFLDPTFRRFDYLTGRLDAVRWWMTRQNEGKEKGNQITFGDALDMFRFEADPGFEMLTDLSRSTHDPKEMPRAALTDPEAHALYLVWAAVATHRHLTKPDEPWPTGPYSEAEQNWRTRVLGKHADLRKCMRALPRPTDADFKAEDGAGGLLCRLAAAERASTADWCKSTPWNRGTLAEAQFRQACFSHRPWHTLKDEAPDRDDDHLGDFLVWRHQTQLGLLSRSEAVEARAGGMGRLPLAAAQAAAAHNHLWSTSDWGFHHTSIPHRIQQSGAWGAVTRLMIPSGLHFVVRGDEADDGTRTFKKQLADASNRLRLDWSLIHLRRNNDRADAGLWLAGGISYMPDAPYLTNDYEQKATWALGPRVEFAASWERSASITDVGFRANLLWHAAGQSEGWRLGPQVFVRSAASHFEVAVELFPGYLDDYRRGDRLPWWLLSIGVTDLGGLIYWAGRLAGVDMTGPDMVKRAGASPL